MAFGALTYSTAKPALPGKASLVAANRSSATGNGRSSRTSATPRALTRLSVPALTSCPNPLRNHSLPERGSRFKGSNALAPPGNSTALPTTRAASGRPFISPYGARRMGSASKGPLAVGAPERSCCCTACTTGLPGMRAPVSASRRWAMAGWPPTCSSHAYSSDPPITSRWAPAVCAPKASARRYSPACM